MSEAVTEEAVAEKRAPPTESERPRNRIQVSRDKKPLSFYVNLAKKLLASEKHVELSGLGMAVTTSVTIAAILKNTGHVDLQKVETSLADVKDDEDRRSMPKAKIQIWIVKSDRFADLMKEEEQKREHSRPSDTAANKPPTGEQPVADNIDANEGERPWRATVAPANVMHDGIDPVAVAGRA